MYMIHPGELLKHLTDEQIRANVVALLERYRDRRETLATTARFILEATKGLEDPATQIDATLRSRDAALELTIIEDVMSALTIDGNSTGAENS